MVNSASGLSTELIKSGLADKVAQVNILVDGEVVDTIQPSQLTDSPLGLTYEGSVDNLDVSANAENVVTAEVVFNDNTITTSAEFTVTAGDGELLDASGNPIVEVAEISIKTNSVFSILSILIKHLLLKKYTFNYYKICVCA